MGFSQFRASVLISGIVRIENAFATGAEAIQPT